MLNYQRVIDERSPRKKIRASVFRKPKISNQQIHWRSIKMAGESQAKNWVLHPFWTPGCSATKYLRKLEVGQKWKSPVSPFLSRGVNESTTGLNGQLKPKQKKPKLKTVANFSVEEPGVKTQKTGHC
jgi:hypothetical protein